MTSKEHLHDLIDGLPEHDLESVAEYIEKLHIASDPRLPRVLREAPWDDEPVETEEAEGDAEAWEDLRAGRVVSHAEARRRLLGET